jgi:glycosyltransferase involved in cell wall biosynthesis
LLVAVVACAFATDVDDPDALLDRYRGPNGWSDALAEAGATVAVVQRFRRSLVRRRGQVDFHFVADGAPPSPPAHFWGAEVARAVRALGPDVVHVDGLVFPAVVRNLRMALPRCTAILVQDHGGLPDPRALFRSLPRRLLFAAGLRAADGFLFTSREQAAPWRRAGVLGASQAIYELPEGSADRADLVGAPGLDGAERALPGRPALLWVGRLDANKDPLTVLRGFERAAPSMPESALTLVFGDDALLPEVRAAIAGSEVLRGRVHLRGRVPREALGALYAAADLFVLGSHHEGSGYALIEALSFGVTPVVADIAPFRRLTGDGRLGALFAPGDAAGLARALVGLAGVDLGARRPAVRAHFERELSWPVIGRKALEVYRAASRARATRGP